MDEPVADAPAFPVQTDLDAAGDALERAAKRAATRVRRLRTRENRRRARELVQKTWSLLQTLRNAEPGSQEARLAMRSAHDLARSLAAAVGQSPESEDSLDPDLLGLGQTSVRLATESFEARDPVRLDWPIRCDLDRMERVGEAGWSAFEHANRLEEAAEELEKRAREAAGRMAEDGRPRTPVVDMDTMELARSQGRRKGGPGGTDQGKR